MKANNWVDKNIATIIACRLKSTRLKRKALINIGELTSIELCIKHALEFNNINYTILATSSVEEDFELSKHTYRDDVIFHQGDPDDVIQRYLDISQKLNIDVVVRLTGDNPFPSKEVCQYLLDSHFKNDSDYTAPIESTIGTSVEIINVSALKKIKNFFPRAEYSEYMTFYFRNNPDYFNINLVELPANWIRNYRLTLDYEEDLEVLRAVENYLTGKNLEYNLFNLFSFLDSNPEISKLNAHRKLQFKTDQELIDVLNKNTKIGL